jgi:clan AA aspartic protease
MNMPGQKEKKMGRVTAEIELANYADMKYVEAGTLAADKVRRVKLTALVDTGATRLVLPQSVVKQLGLPSTGKVGVRYADERRQSRDMVSDVWLKLLGRQSVFNAVVEPKRKEALIGAIVLEDLDLVVDCPTQKLHPRDPDRIISEIE